MCSSIQAAFEALHLVFEVQHPLVLVVVQRMLMLPTWHVAWLQVKALIAGDAALLEKYERSLLESYVEVRPALQAPTCAAMPASLPCMAAATPILKPSNLVTIA